MVLSLKGKGRLNYGYIERAPLTASGASGGAVARPALQFKKVSSSGSL